MNSSASLLSVYAGSTAYEEIQQHGFSQQQFHTLVGASGGPKWFVLYGLDRYLFGEFFKSRSQPLELIGSSAGAWRLSCLAQSDPVAAIERLAYFYSRERYSEHPSVEEISEKARLLVKNVLGDTGAMDIVENSIFRLCLFTDRSRWLTSSENKILLSLGLALCAVANGINRKLLCHFFHRVIFYGGLSKSELSQLENLSDLPTSHVALQQDNIQEALLATGAIPLALSGVKNIQGAAKGVYRDGGITDYHFDIPFNSAGKQGLVLYPHFYSHVIPGWFDKILPWRFQGEGYNAFSSNYKNVVLLCPSQQFVDSLPYSKIPDRADFKNLDFQTRFDYWQTAMSRSEELAEEFQELVENGKIVERIKRF